MSKRRFLPHYIKQIGTCSTLARYSMIKLSVPLGTDFSVYANCYITTLSFITFAHPVGVRTIMVHDMSGVLLVASCFVKAC